VLQNDKISGKYRRGFPTTRWSLLQKAQPWDEDYGNYVADNLIQRYWKPVYYFLKQKGYSNENAEDLTQRFLHEVVLGHELAQLADRSKGRFRTFLLTALIRYLTSEHRKEVAKKRFPSGHMLSLESSNIPSHVIMGNASTPDEIFEYVWATNLLDQIMATLKDECNSEGLGIHWKVFHAKLVAPVLENTESPPLKILCDKYGISSETKASNMIITVKRRYAAVLRRYLRKMVQSDAEVEEEYRELMVILSKGCAG
jgi:DNA-directed RNA polymerase specialized sigma24 family protein